MPTRKGGEMSSRGAWTSGLPRVAVPLATMGVVALLAFGVGSAVGSPTGGWGWWGHSTQPAFSDLTNISLANTVAANSTEVFAAGQTNCSQIVGITPSGAVSIYATVPVQGLCQEGALALAPFTLPPITCTPTCNVTDVSSEQAGAWGHPPCGNHVNQTLYYVEHGDLFEITDNGSIVSLVATFPVPNKASENMGLTYDQVGMFDHDLIVTGSSGGRIWLVNQSGGVTLFDSLHTYIAGPSVAPSTFGSYGGDLIVAAKTLGQVDAINSSGAVSVVTNWTKAVGVAFQSSSGHGGCGGWGSGCSFGPNHDIFFLANYSSGAIEAFPASDFWGVYGQGIVAGGENNNVASFTPGGVTTLFASGTERIGNIAFITCFSGSGHYQWYPAAGHGWNAS